MEQKKIFAVSDLHIGITQSAWKRDLETVKAAIRQCDDVVFCGDIFEGFTDLMFTKTPPDLVGVVMEELAARARAHGTHLHFMFGNHEAPIIDKDNPHPHLTPVAVKMQEIINQNSDVMTLHEKGWVKMGDVFFTHGHLQTHLIDNAHHSYAEKILSFIANLGMFPALSNAKFPRKEAREQMYAGSKEALDCTQPNVIAHIISGHRHDPTPPEGETLEGTDTSVRFHDLGTSVIGRPDLFRPLVIEQDEQGNTASIQGKEALQSHNQTIKGGLGIGR